MAPFKCLQQSIKQCCFQSRLFVMFSFESTGAVLLAKYDSFFSPEVALFQPFSNLSKHFCSHFPFVDEFIPNIHIVMRFEFQIIQRCRKQKIFGFSLSSLSLPAFLRSIGIFKCFSFQFLRRQSSIIYTILYEHSAATLVISISRSSGHGSADSTFSIPCMPALSLFAQAHNQLESNC